MSSAGVMIRAHKPPPPVRGGLLHSAGPFLGAIVNVEDGRVWRVIGYSDCASRVVIRCADGYRRKELELYGLWCNAGVWRLPTEQGSLL